MAPDRTARASAAWPAVGSLNHLTPAPLPATSARPFTGTGHPIFTKENKHETPIYL